MRNIFSDLPDPEIVLEFEPPEIAFLILKYLKSYSTWDRDRLQRDYIVSRPPDDRDIPPAYHDLTSDIWNKMTQAIMEAWCWLEREGLLAPIPLKNPGHFFITRAGQRLDNTTDLQAYRVANLLPKDLLHPLIAERVRSAFLRGEYDVAVFQAFRDRAFNMCGDVRRSQSLCSRTTKLPPSTGYENGGHGSTFWQLVQ